MHNKSHMELCWNENLVVVVIRGESSIKKRLIASVQNCPQVQGLDVCKLGNKCSEEFIVKVLQL
jgi:hypothetical protein